MICGFLKMCRILGNFCYDYLLGEGLWYEFKNIWIICFMVWCFSSFVGDFFSICVSGVNFYVENFFMKGKLLKIVDIVFY